MKPLIILLQLARPHGTDVAVALIDIAPDAKLYISNANDSSDAWSRLLTGFLTKDDVKVINRSRGGTMGWTWRWELPFWHG